MRKSKYFILFTILISFCSCATKNVALDQLEGTWLLKNNEPDNILEYQRISDQEKYEGSILKISQDSVIVDSYTMECYKGMSTFFSEGIWNLDEKKLLLKSTVPIDLQGQIFKIKELNSTKFVLAKINMK
ncbi:MAG: hypothetical protein V7734_16345 [Maribacter arcticus]|uniref:hypothetical protein n=1 Tax=Maribacter arcticus TaxID=561365 RepID=UPI0030012452